MRWTKTLIVVLAHRGVEQTLTRHIPHWTKPNSDLVFLSPTDARVLPESVNGHRCMFIGGQAHCGIQSLIKIKSTLNWMCWLDYSSFVLTEYDGIFLGDLPEDTGKFMATRFDNTEPHRFRSASYWHCPWFMPRAILLRLSDEMNKMDSSEECGYLDRFIGVALQNGNIPAEGYANSYSQNTVDQRFIPEMQEAIRNRNVTILHGVKSSETLNAALSALPK